MEGKMKKKVIWLGLGLLMVAAMLLASCGTSSNNTQCPQPTNINHRSCTYCHQWEHYKNLYFSGAASVTTNNRNWWDTHLWDSVLIKVLP